MSLKLNRISFGNPQNDGNVLSRDEAFNLLTEWVKNERLQLHMKQVGHLMKCWAQEKESLPEADQWRWEMAGHGPNHFGVEPETRMDKMLYAFDELSGLIHAYSLMRPEGYAGMELKGVKKRLKEKSFAANVNRDEIMDALNRAGIDLETLVPFIIEKQQMSK